MAVDVLDHGRTLHVGARGSAAGRECCAVLQVVDAAELLDAARAFVLLRVVIRGIFRNACDDRVQIFLLGSSVGDIRVCLRVQELEARDVLLLIIQHVVVYALAVRHIHEGADLLGADAPPCVDRFQTVKCLLVHDKEDRVGIAVKEILVADRLDCFHELVTRKGCHIYSDGVGHEVIPVRIVAAFTISGIRIELAVELVLDHFLRLNRNMPCARFRVHGYLRPYRVCVCHAEDTVQAVFRLHEVNLRLDDIPDRSLCILQLLYTLLEHGLLYEELVDRVT